MFIWYKRPIDPLGATCLASTQRLNDLAVIKTDGAQGALAVCDLKQGNVLATHILQNAAAHYPRVPIPHLSIAIPLPYSARCPVAPILPLFAAIF